VSRLAEAQRCEIGGYHEDSLLHSLERFIEKIRPKEKAEKKKGGKKLLADAAFVQVAPSS
jgi:hypothetical protein